LKTSKKAPRSHGSGNLFQDHGAWFLRVYEGKNRRRKIRLGRVEDYPTQKSIQSLIEEELSRLRNAGSGRFLTLDRYISSWYLPVTDGTCRPSTAKGYRGLYKRYIKDRKEAQLLLRDYRVSKIQDLLNSIAADFELRKTTLATVKHFLSGAFRIAAVTGLINESENPVTQTMLPSRALPSTETQFYTLDELEKVLPELPLAARAAVAVAGYAGLRLAEIQGLEWEDYDGATLTIRQTQWRGEISPPKSRASGGSVPVIPQLRVILDEHRATGSGTGLMFRESLDHVGRRAVRSAMKSVGLKWKGWHSFRRGVASTLFRLGASDMIVMKILRHSRVSITRDRYVKIADPAVEAAMAMMSGEIVKRAATTGRATDAVIAVSDSL
jgi:integrase